MIHCRSRGARHAKTRVLLLALCSAALLGAQPSDKLRVGLFSAVPVKWDLEANWRAFERTFLAHAGENLDVVVTPECFLDGYTAVAKDWTQEHFPVSRQCRRSATR